MTVNIRTTVNGWLVEVWRDRRSPREEYVYTREQHEQMLDFVRDLTAGGL